MKASRSKYDSFFSQSMEIPSIAKAFFRHALPSKILQLVDLSDLTRVDRVHTSAKLEQGRRDIVYELPTVNGGTLLACVEHQSSADTTMAIRFLRYSTDIMESYSKDGKGIPMVVNILFYHGDESPYPHHSTLQDYYSHPVIGASIMGLRFFIIDVTKMSDKMLLAWEEAAPMMLLLKHGKKGNFELEPAAYRDVFRACIASAKDEYIETMLHYAATLSDRLVGEKMFAFIKEILTEKKDVIMTYGQALENRGKRVGRREGRNEGRREGILSIARNMLSRGYDASEVQALTGMSGEALRAVVR